MTDVNWFEIGGMAGMRRAFSKLAANCSVADAQILRKVRESKEYLSLSTTWEEFCPKYLGIDRSTADRLIRRLDEFGPESFETMHQLGLSPRQYRLVQSRSEGDALRHQGQTIRLLPENSRQIHAALREMRRKAVANGAPALAERLAALENRCAAVAEEFRALCGLGPDEEDRKRISAVLTEAAAQLLNVAREHRL